MYHMRHWRKISLFSISDRLARQKGSGAHVIAGLIILIIGVAFGLSVESDAVVVAAIVIVGVSQQQGQRLK